jgi:hypothetical protein
MFWWLKKIPPLLNQNVLMFSECVMKGKVGRGRVGIFFRFELFYLYYYYFLLLFLEFALKKKIADAVSKKNERKQKE